MNRLGVPACLAFGSLLGAALLTGCVRPPAPLDARQVLELPEAWRAGRVGKAGSGPFWRRFDDDRLTRLVTEALATNHDLAAAARRVDAAAAAARQAGAPLWPELSASLGSSRRKQNFIGLPIPGRDVASSTSTSLQLGLSVSWEADLWGRLRADQQVATAELSAARRDRDAAELALAVRVARIYFSLVEARQQVALAEATVTNRKRALDRASRRYEAGLVEALDVRLATSSEASARSLLAIRERQRDVAARQLEVLLGRYPEGDVQAASDLPPVPSPPELGAPASVIARRPDLQAAEERLGASGARVAAARAALYPRLRLTGSGGTTSQELGDLLNGDFSVWSLASGLLQPLFQGGRLRARVDGAEASLESAKQAFVQQVLVALGEVENALGSASLVRVQERALGQAAIAASAAETTSEERYAAGLADYLLLLESQRLALTTRSQWIEARRLSIDVYLDLVLALGGDWPGSAGMGSTKGENS